MSAPAGVAGDIVGSLFYWCRLDSSSPHSGHTCPFLAACHRLSSACERSLPSPSGFSPGTPLRRCHLPRFSSLSPSSPSSACPSPGVLRSAASIPPADAPAFVSFCGRGTCSKAWSDLLLGCELTGRQGALVPGAGGVGGGQAPPVFGDSSQGMSPCSWRGGGAPAGRWLSPPPAPSCDSGSAGAACAKARAG